MGRVCEDGGVVLWIRVGGYDVFQRYSLFLPPSSSSADLRLHKSYTRPFRLESVASRSKWVRTMR